LHRIQFNLHPPALLARCRAADRGPLQSSGIASANAAAIQLTDVTSR